MRKFAKYSWAIMLLLIVAQITSCKKDEKEPEVISSFTFVVDAANYKLVTFTSTAQNFASLSWNFGDNSAVSTETNPAHTFPAVGDYNVTLTATSPGGATDVYTEKITIADPNAALTILVGDVSKTWKLIRKPNGPRYPLLVMKFDRSEKWWACGGPIGGGDNEIQNRPCIFNDTWVFNRNLSMVYDAGGDYWREGGYFDPANKCDATTNMVGINGDCSKWGNGTHTFALTSGANQTLTVTGLGAFVGFYKVGTGLEFKVPQASVTYNVVKLSEGTVDTLIIEAPYKFAAADATYGGIWQFVLVHYDNPAEEPPIPGPKPSAGYTFTVSGLTATFTNTTTDGVTYAWDFGDGQTSTAQNPTHTYTTGGPYVVKLTATNPNGDGSTQKVVFPTTDVLTDAALQGTAWKVRAEEMSVFVGQGLGGSNWWALPKSYMVSGTGVDDWTCITNDEFKFAAGGVFTYDTKGSTRNDGYFGGTNGCITDAGIAASTNGAPLGSGTHSYAFTAAAGETKAKIVLTSVAGKAAFLGFYKGYNGVDSGKKGGENNGTDPANFGSATNSYWVMGYAHTATKDYLYVSVDISAAHDASAAWSMILER